MISFTIESEINAAAVCYKLYGYNNGKQGAVKVTEWHV